MLLTCWLLVLPSAHVHVIIDHRDSGTHRYVFTLYAVYTVLPLSEGATKAEVGATIDGHVLEQSQLTGQRDKE